MADILRKLKSTKVVVFTMSMLPKVNISKHNTDNSNPSLLSPLGGPWVHPNLKKADADPSGLVEPRRADGRNSAGRDRQV